MPHLKDTEAEESDFVFNDPAQLDEARFLRMIEEKDSSIDRNTSSGESNAE
jgi:hypothetical protein